MHTMWSTDSLKSRVKGFSNNASANGNRILSVSFGVNMWWMPTAFITLEKSINNNFEG